MPSLELDCRVSVPEGALDGVVIERFTVGPDDLQNLRSVLHNRPPVPPGTYTRLACDGVLWMSDTPAEQQDHLPFFNALYWTRPRVGGRVLINGLGIGMCLQAALRTPWVRHIDVVENDARVIALVAPHYETLARELGKTLEIRLGDAYAIPWPVGTKWDVAWHDIWPTISADNVPGMTRLMRRYGHRVDWQGCWARQESLDVRSGRAAREHAQTMERFYHYIGLDIAAVRALSARTEGTGNA